jgi:hypothetical protein
VGCAGQIPDRPPDLAAENGRYAGLNFGTGLDKHAPRFKWSMAHNEIHHRSGISRFHSPV